MNGREDKKSNDLFFTCSLIEYIARKTKNPPSFVAEKLSVENIEKIYELADVYHSDNIDDVSDSFIEKCHIESGNFDNVSACMYSVPTHWDMGKVYKRLVKMVAERYNLEIAEAVKTVYASKVSEMLENYNSDFYYQSPELIFEEFEDREKEKNQ